MCKCELTTHSKKFIFINNLVERQRHSIKEEPCLELLREMQLKTWIIGRNGVHTP